MRARADEAINEALAQRMRDTPKSEQQTADKSADWRKGECDLQKGRALKR